MRPPIVAALCEAAVRRPGGVAVVEAASGRRVTCAGLLDLVGSRARQLDRALPDLGGPGHRPVVAVEHDGPEGVDLLVDVLACAAAGAVALVRNTAHPGPLWRRQCAAARPVAALRPGEPPLVSPGWTPAVMHPDTYQIVATSGSTGAPKLVQLTQQGTLAATAVYRARVPLAAGETVAVPQSLATVGALPSGVLPALLAGGTAVLGHGWGVRTFLDALDDHEVVFAMAVTGWWQACLAAPWPPLPRLRVLGVGGAPWHHLVPEVRRRLPHVEVLGNYGLTETHGPALQVSTDERAHLDGVAGRLVPGIEADVRDEELWLRGPLLTPGYLGGPQHLDADGWFRTGDVARALAEGWFRVVDRADDLVNVGGRKVYPAEVEAVLRRIRGVADCAVVRTEAPVDRRHLAAYVVAGGPTPTIQDLRRSVREAVGSHAVPAVIEMVASLPRTGSGKVDREALRARAGRETAGTSSDA